MTSDKGDQRGFLRSVRSFVLGGLFGASAALATRRRRRQRDRFVGGLKAFDDAPCHREAIERKQKTV